jgi:hypothetical protein
MAADEALERTEAPAFTMTATSASIPPLGTETSSAAPSKARSGHGDHFR